MPDKLYGDWETEVADLRAEIARLQAALKALIPIMAIDEGCPYKYCKHAHEDVSCGVCLEGYVQNIIDNVANEKDVTTLNNIDLTTPEGV